MPPTRDWDNKIFLGSVRSQPEHVYQAESVLGFTWYYGTGGRHNYTPIVAWTFTEPLIVRLREPTDGANTFLYIEATPDFQPARQPDPATGQVVRDGHQFTPDQWVHADPASEVSVGDARMHIDFPQDEVISLQSAQLGQVPGEEFGVDYRTRGYDGTPLEYNKDYSLFSYRIGSYATWEDGANTPLFPGQWSPDETIPGDPRGALGFTLKAWQVWHGVPYGDPTPPDPTVVPPCPAHPPWPYVKPSISAGSGSYGILRGTVKP